MLSCRRHKPCEYAVPWAPVTRTMSWVKSSGSDELSEVGGKRKFGGTARRREDWSEASLRSVDEFCDRLA